MELQRAIRASLGQGGGEADAADDWEVPGAAGGGGDLARVLELSRREEEERLRRLETEEEEALRKVIELSLLEK